jgi:DNA-binding transcriptional LysR family regulator
VLGAIQTAKQQLNMQYHLQKNRKLLLSTELATLLPLKQLSTLFSPQQFWQVHTAPTDANRHNWHDYDAVVQAGVLQTDAAPLESYCLGYLSWWPVSATEQSQPANECGVLQSQQMPKLGAAPLSFVSSDVRLVWQWLQQHKGCGYLPAILVQAAVEQGKLHKLNAAVVQQPVYAFSQPGESWPEQWQTALQGSAVLQSQL